MTLKIPTVGQFGYSVAGHDKGAAYIVVKIDGGGEYVYLADGKAKTLKTPKKKKFKHFRVVADIKPDDLTTDTKIKRAIKLASNNEQLAISN